MQFQWKNFSIHTSWATLRAITIGLILGAILIGYMAGKLSAQAPPSAPGQLNYSASTAAMAIPTSLSDVIKQDAWICAADFTATGTQTLTIQDKQSTPIPWINAPFTTPGGSTFMFTAPTDLSCRFMKGGISWQASASGVTGHLVIKCANGPCQLVAGNY